jgi:hypothetical protein
LAYLAWQQAVNDEQFVRVFFAVDSGVVGDRGWIFRRCGGLASNEVKSE